MAQRDEPHWLSQDAGPSLFLVPMPLSGQAQYGALLQPLTLQVLESSELILAENLRSARRAISAMGPSKPISEMQMEALHKKTPPEEWQALLEMAQNCPTLSYLSEAGAPAVADPGAELVQWAHRQGRRVIPLPGPSAILMALMASGLNGQSFAFLGYLPQQATQRQKRIKELEKSSAKQNQTQIFIETPYRNNALARDLFKALKPNTLLCIAQDLTGPSEHISTATVGEWRAANPDFPKLPAVFLVFSQ